MKETPIKRLTLQCDVNKHVEKRIAKVVYDAIHNWHTLDSEDIHQLIRKAILECAPMRGSGGFARELICVEECAKLGYHVGLLGLTSFKVSFPDFLRRRWRAVAREAMRMGIAVAKSKHDTVPSTKRAEVA